MDAIAAMAGRKFLVLSSHAAYLSIAIVFGYHALNDASVRLGCGSMLFWALVIAMGVLVASATFMSSVLHHGVAAQKILKVLMCLPVASWRSKVRARATSFSDTDARLTQIFEAPARHFCWPVAACLASWLFEALETHLMLRLLGLELPFAAALAMEASVSFARHVLVVLPAGLGVQDLGYAAMLGALGIPDALTLSVAFAVLKRAKEAFWAATGFSLWFFSPRGGAPGLQLLQGVAAK